MPIKIFEKEQLGKGRFDGGKITEIKPIGFHSTESTVLKIGPLYYWAWATATEEAIIPSHPHRGFEIMSYVTGGELQHTDTLGSKVSIFAGGLQIMRTGKGVWHEEKFVAPPVDMMQIWFDPQFKTAIKEEPSYQFIPHEDFPISQPAEGVIIKTILGGNSPAKIKSPAQFLDANITSGSTYTAHIAPGECWGVLGLEGKCQIKVEGNEPATLAAKSFAVIEQEPQEVEFLNHAETNFRALIISCPTDPGYRTFMKN